MGFVKGLVTGRPDTYGVDTSAYGPLVAQLQAQAAGRGPNIAAQEAQNAIQANTANAAAVVNAQKGISPALQARQVAYAQGQAGQQVAGEAALARLRQQVMAQQQLGGLMEHGQAVNAEVAARNAQFQGQLLGGALQGAGGALGIKGTGGMAEGGAVQPGATPAGPASALGQWLQGAGAAATVAPHVEALRKLEAGGPIDFRSGGDIPGEARVAGDDEQNDTVPILASPGEVMLPRSVAEAPDAPNAAADFVRKLQRRSGKSRGYERVVRARRG